MPDVHATLSPSSAHRWLSCTPSALLEAEFKSTPSEAAAEGTAAHALCEHKLRRKLKLRSSRPTSNYETDEMDEYTTDYVTFVLEKIAELNSNPLVRIEERVDFSEFVPKGFGTADCIIIGEDTLHVIDFKYGQGVLVSADNNSQMMCYALGALNSYSMIYDIQKVKMSIYQPRRENISTFSISSRDLLIWAEEVLKPKAELAIKGEGDFKVGDWCCFCRAKVKCRARAEAQLELAREEFKLPPLLDDSEINEILPKLEGLGKWATDVMNYASDSAINHGKKWTGFKVVEGRSVRKYRDEKSIENICKTNGYSDIYKRSIIGITEMTKLMGKATFEKLLGSELIKPKGKLTLVPETDKRKEVILNEFKKEE